jgi:hypothetical protein
MSMAFYLTCIPQAEITDERLGVLREIVGKLTKDDCSDDVWETFEEWVQAVTKAVELLAVLHEKHGREINDLPVFAEQPYGVLFTGGFAASGSDLDLFNEFEAIRSATPVVAKLVQWAKADKQDPRSLAASSPDWSRTPR